MAPRSVLHGDAALRWELWGGGGPGREKVGDTRREKPPPSCLSLKMGHYLECWRLCKWGCSEG